MSSSKYVFYIFIILLSSQLYLTSTTKTYRQIKECHKVAEKDETFEHVLSSTIQSQLQVKPFIDDVPGGRYAYGHLSVVSNPRTSLSFYEPDGVGSCSTKPHTNQKTLTEISSQYNCEYASNAGFFNITTGMCLGNMWSDGRLVSSEGKMNPSFGILENGTILTGYLSEKHVRDLPWRNLIQGLIWLVRDGEKYVSESLAMECGDEQTNGDLNNFAAIVSARAAIGHDAEGRVLLAHVEGQSNVRGVSLDEFAEILMKNGFVNAINLDGGRRVTVTRDFKLIS